MNWAWLIAGGLAATTAITLGGIAVALVLAWSGRRRADGDALALQGGKPPAPGRADTWPPGDHCAGPPSSVSVPAPGTTPGPAASPPPVPAHDCGRPVFGIVIYDCECAYALSPRTLQWRQANHCGRTDFNTAEWEAKLRDR